MVDKNNGSRAISDVFDTRMIYDGPDLANAPDLVVGYNEGYRVSWSTATGRVTGEVLEYNLRPWSGDYAIDSRLVPGVFFCSRRVDTSDPAPIHIAPTALQPFGLRAPSYMEGRTLLSTMLGAGSRERRRPDARTAIRVLRVWGDAPEASTRPLESFSVLPIALAVACAACGGPHARWVPRRWHTIVLGFDGLDYDSLCP